MESDELRTSLAEYEAQLLVINEALATSQDNDTTAELNTLKRDLNELIDVTKAQLLDVMKSELLAQVDQQDEPSTSSTQMEMSEDASNDNDDQEMTPQTLLDSLVGIRCYAPYTGSDMPLRCPVLLHTAVIMDVVEEEQQLYETDVADQKLRVLFCNPVCNGMRPCAYFMDERCNYGVKCKYSHGNVVCFSDLVEYVEPEFDNWSKEQLLLIPDEKTSLWSLARYNDHDNHGNVDVELLSTSASLAVAREQTVPCHPCQMAQSNSSQVTHSHVNHQSSLYDDDDESQSSLASATSTSQQNAASKLVSDDFGGWEQHTKGFGSKIMAKMGYVVGDGLGVEQRKGRLEPIEPKMYAKGKSLDRAMELREKHGAKDLYARVKAEKLRLERIEAKRKRTNQTEAGIFSFMNRRCGKTKKKAADVKLRPQNASDARRVNKTSDKGLNIEVFKLDEKIRGWQKEISGYKKSMARNVGDRNVCGKLKEKMTHLEKLIQQSTSRRDTMQREANSRRSSKKFVGENHRMLVMDVDMDSIPNYEFEADLLFSLPAELPVLTADEVDRELAIFDQVALVPVRKRTIRVPVPRAIGMHRVDAFQDPPVTPNPNRDVNKKAVMLSYDEMIFVRREQIAADKSLKCQVLSMDQDTNGRMIFTVVLADWVNNIKISLDTINAGIRGRHRVSVDEVIMSTMVRQLAHLELLDASSNQDLLKIPREGLHRDTLIMLHDLSHRYIARVTGNGWAQILSTDQRVEMERFSRISLVPKSHKKSFVLGCAGVIPIWCYAKDQRINNIPKIGDLVYGSFSEPDDWGRRLVDFTGI